MKKLTGIYLIVDALLPFIIIAVIIYLYAQYISTVKQEYTQVNSLMTGIKNEGKTVLEKIGKAKSSIAYEFCQLDNSVIHLRNSAKALQHFSNNICTGKPLVLKPAQPRACREPDNQASIFAPALTGQNQASAEDFVVDIAGPDVAANYIIKTSLVDGASDTAKNVGSFINRNIIDKGEDIFRGVKKGIIKTPQIACSGVTAPFKFIAGELRKTMVPFQYINNALIHFSNINEQLSDRFSSIESKTQEVNSRLGNLTAALLKFFDYFFWLVLFISGWYLFRYYFVMVSKINKGMSLLRGQ